MKDIHVLRHNYLAIYSNSFALQGEGGTIWIDSGLNGNADILAPFLSASTALIATHGHWDHIGLHDYLKHNGARLYAHPGDRRYLEDHAWHWQDLFGQYRQDFDLPPARETVFAQSIGAPVSIDTEIADGQTLSLYGRALSVLHTPGHSDGSVCLLEEETGALFTGDSLMGTGFFTGLPQYTDPAAYIISMQRLKALTVDTVYSCHNDPMPGKLLAQKAQDGIDMTLAIENCIRENLRHTGQPVLRELVAQVCRHFDKGVGGGACVTVLAHLQRLQEEFPAVIPIVEQHQEEHWYV